MASKKPKKKSDRANRIKRIEAENKALKKLNDMSDFKFSDAMQVAIDKLKKPGAINARFEESSTEHSRLKNLVSTKCPKCNLKLIVPEVESNRCILCGCKELVKQPYV